MKNNQTRQTKPSDSKTLARSKTQMQCRKDETMPLIQEHIALKKDKTGLRNAQETGDRENLSASKDEIVTPEHFNNQPEDYCNNYYTTQEKVEFCDDHKGTNKDGSVHSREQKVEVFSPLKSPEYFQSEIKHIKNWLQKWVIEKEQGKGWKMLMMEELWCNEK